MEDPEERYRAGRTVIVSSPTDPDIQYTSTNEIHLRIDHVTLLSISSKC